MKFALEIRQGREVALEFAERLEKSIQAGGAVLVEDGAIPDMVLAVGGDGTMLAAVGRSLRHRVPVLGFNLGTIGFLTEAEPEAMTTIVKRLLAGDYQIHERMTITATVGASEVTGVNDVVVEKIDSRRLVELEVSIDGKSFMTYRADGIIVATPTGSTAYSFSAGGPLVAPTINALILTPVAAHSLFDQSLVLDPGSELGIRVARDRPVKVSVDKNDLGRITEGEAVVVKAGVEPARFVSLDQSNFAQLVKTKFELG